MAFFGGPMTNFPGSGLLGALLAQHLAHQRHKPPAPAPVHLPPSQPFTPDPQAQALANQPGLPSWVTDPGDRLRYQQDTAAAKDAATQVQGQEQKMAAAPDLQYQAPQYQQPNPYVTMGQALAMLIAPRISQPMAMAANAQKTLADEQYQRDLDNQQLRMQAYDRDVENQTRRLTALQAISAEKDKAQQNDLKDFLSKDKNDQAYYLAMAKMDLSADQFGKTLQFKNKHEQDWVNNNKDVLAERYKSLTNQYQIAGLRARNASYIAEMKVRAQAANVLLQQRVALAKAQMTQATGRDRLAWQQQYQKASLALNQVNGLDRNIASLEGSLSRAILPQQQSAIQGQIQALVNKRTIVQNAIGNALDNPFSLAPISEQLDQDATGEASALSAIDQYGSTVPGAGGQPNITINVGQPAAGASAPAPAATPAPATPGGGGQAEFKALYDDALKGGKDPAQARIAAIDAYRAAHPDAKPAEVLGWLKTLGGSQAAPPFPRR